MENKDSICCRPLDSDFVLYYSFIMCEVVQKEKEKSLMIFFLNTKLNDEIYDDRKPTTSLYLLCLMSTGLLLI